MVVINNWCEINHIKSFIIPISRPHVLDMGDIDSDGGQFGFCSMKKIPQGCQSGTRWIMIWTTRRFQKANKTLYNPQYHVQCLAAELIIWKVTLANACIF